MIRMIALAFIIISTFIDSIPALADSPDTFPAFSKMISSCILSIKPIDSAYFFTGSIGVVILILLLILLVISHKKLRLTKAELKNFNQLRQAFIDADESLTYLKDENLKYVFVNKALENYYQMRAQDIIGLDDYALKNDDLSNKHRETDLAVLEKEKLIVGEEEWQGRLYRSTKFPVRMLNGMYGVGAYISDITEDREKLRKLQRMMYRHKILADVLTMSFQGIQEQLDYVLHQSLLLTESKYGYIYLYDEDNQEFTLNSWTNGVMEDCAVTDQQTKYRLDKTGIWGEVVRQRKPIVVNNFEQANPLKKGYPEGHVKIKRFMSIPVIIDEKIVAVVGLANNSFGYDDNDVFEMTVLMNGVWNAITRRQMQTSLSFERNKYLQTLISIGDGILVVDKDQKIEMLNTVAESLTGWKQEDAFGQYYKDVFVLSSELEDSIMNDPITAVLETNMIQELGNHAVLTSKDGTTYYIEDSAAPIRDETGGTQGVVLVFRDVTDKKEQRKKIEYLSFHDSLTGLYNRRFFEEEIHRLDTVRNLPISIIMGDVDSLKLANDVFGHTFGDALLEKIAKVLQNVCRADDIIARWGGDEFVILLPKTTADEAKRIDERIKKEFGKEKIKAIKGSISIGFATKQEETDDITQVLNMAEKNMYLTKTLKRDEVRSATINEIMTTLHENSAGERKHSLGVSALSQRLGKTLNLGETEIIKLKEAGYLHDIGKIVLNPRLLNKKNQLTRQDKDEIKRHTTVGYRILSSFENTMDMADCVLSHHEHWNGSGYPRGLKENEIPLLARIISVVENYDRIINNSDINLQLEKVNALEKLNEKAGTVYDPTILSAFAQMIKTESNKASC